MLIQQRNLSVFEPRSSKLKDLRRTNPTKMDRINDLPAIKYNDRNFFHATEGGLNLQLNHPQSHQFVIKYHQFS